MHKRSLALLFFCTLPLFAHALGDYNPVAAGAGKPEIHITADGVMMVKGAKVDQLVGTTLFLTLKWGDLPMRVIMKTDAKTLVTKRYGGTTTVAEVKLGDYLDTSGEFFVGSDAFGMTARTVKDWSLQEESETYSGVITEVRSDGAFTLQTPSKPITLRLLNSVSIKKGRVVIPASRIMKGDSVVLADGVYDYASNTLTASSLIIFQAQTEFLAKNYQGVIKSIGGNTLPATLVVTVDGVDYTVKVGATAEVLRNNRKSALIARFVTGDTVRFYGALREAEKTLNDERIIDASILRNLNL